MPNRTPNPDNADQVVIRRARPEDREAIDRLVAEGLIPGYFPYLSDEAKRIRESLGTAREPFLVAEVDEAIVGTLAIAEAKPGVGHLHWLRVHPDRQADLVVARALARAAAQHAREAGLLKLAMQVPVDAEGRISAYYHRLGFVFSRAREIEGIHVLEFYLNLYERPNLDDLP